MAHVTIPSTPAIARYVVTTPQTDFAIVFPYFDPATDLVVTRWVGGTGTVLEYSKEPGPGQFSVAGTKVDGGFTGGTVTVGGEDGIANCTLTILRAVPPERMTDFPYPSSSIDIRSLNTDSDRFVAMVGDMRAFLGRTLRLPEVADIDPVLPLPLPARRALMTNAAAAGFTWSTYDPDETVAAALDAVNTAHAALDKANAALAMAANAGVGSRKAWGPITLVAGIQRYQLPAAVAQADDLDLYYGGVYQTVQWSITDELGVGRTLTLAPEIVAANPTSGQWLAGMQIWGMLVSGLTSGAIGNKVIQERHIDDGAIDLGGRLIVPGPPNKHVVTNGSGIHVYADYDPSIEWVNVKRYGAAGTGGDDTAAINAAIAAMSPGGTLYFPPGGNYGISAPVQLKSGCVMGMANGSTITALAATGDLFVLAQPHSHIEGLQFQVADGVTRQAGNAAIKVTTGNLSRIRLCRFWDQAHSIWITDQFVATITLEALEINRSVPGAATCIQIDAGYDVTLTDLIISNAVDAMPAWGIYISAAGDVQILNTQVLCCQYGLNVFVPAGKVLASLWAEVALFDNCGRGASIIADGGSIVRCGFNRCWFSSAHVDHGFFAGTGATGAVDGLALTDCDLFLNAANGFTAYSAGVKHVDLLGCRAAANGQSGIAMGVASGAPVNDWSAIGCVAGAYGALAGNTLYGLFAAATPTGHRVASNDLRGNGAGPWAGVPVTSAVIGNLAA